MDYTSYFALMGELWSVFRELYKGKLLQNIKKHCITYIIIMTNLDGI